MIYSVHAAYALISCDLGEALNIALNLLKIND